MSLELPKTSGLYCLSSSFKGQVIDVKCESFVVQTEVGRVYLHTNSSTRFYRLDRRFRSCSNLIRLVRNLDEKTALGQQVMGRMVVYPTSKEGKASNVLCTELIMLGNKAIGLPMTIPDFWIRNITSVADWWYEHSVDRTYGGYYTNISQEGFVQPGLHGKDKWTYVISRTVYCFSSAFALTGMMRYLDAASHGVEFLKRAVFTRKGFSLFRTRMDQQGRRHPEEPELLNIFTQLYCLTGLIAYYDVARSSDTRDLIEKILRSLMRLYYDPQYGGFYDAISELDLKPIVGVTDSKSFNSIVDALSATLYFLKNSGFSTECFELDKVIRELCGLICHHFVDEKHNFIREVFTRSWKFHRPRWCNPYNTPFEAGNIGGCMKVIWVLSRGFHLLGDKERRAAKRVISHLQSSIVSSGAWDTLRGGWFESMVRESQAGSPAEHMWHTDKVWWQQEEGILACMLSYLIGRDKQQLDMALDGLAYWLTYFVDKTNGGVFDTVSIDGIPIKGVKGCWLKGGYHEIELTRFVYIYLCVLKERPVTMYYSCDNFGSSDNDVGVPAQIPGIQWKTLSRRKTDKGVLKVRYKAIKKA